MLSDGFFVPDSSLTGAAYINLIYRNTRVYRQTGI